MAAEARLQQGPQQDDEYEIDLVEIFLQIGAHIRMVLLSTALVAAIVFLFCRFLVTPQYESMSTLYVLSKSTSITSLADVQMGANLTSDYTLVVSSRPVLDKVIQDLGLEETYEELYKKVTVENPNDTRFINITVRDPDINRAKQITDDIATVSADYIAEKMDQDPPTIIQNGYTDSDPVAPKTLRNTVIGAILGFLIAAIVVVVSYLTNDTIQTPDDVEKKLGLQTLGSLPLDEDIEQQKSSGSHRHHRHHRHSSGDSDTKNSASAGRKSDTTEQSRKAE